MDKKYCVFCMNPLTDGVCTFCKKNQSDYNPTPMHLQPGTILNGKYLIGSVVGQGGFGITYIGRDINLDIKIAVKEYFPSGIVNRNTETSTEITSPVGKTADFFNKGKDSFLSEARTLAKFSNEHSIVSVRDFFSENNTGYIVMEYLEGCDLRNHLATSGLLDFKQTVSMLSPVMNALSKIHKQGLIHRDISPANIIILNDGTVKLLDFGAAREVGGADEKSLSILLKPGYAPEEQYRTKGHQGAWTDVYALSATMYKMLTGVTPIDAMNRVFSDELKKPSELNPAITPLQDSVILKGMAIQQADRYQSVEELFNACIAAVENTQVPIEAPAANTATSGGNFNNYTQTITPTQDPSLNTFANVAPEPSSAMFPNNTNFNPQPGNINLPNTNNTIVPQLEKKKSKKAPVFTGILFGIFSLITLFFGYNSYVATTDSSADGAVIGLSVAITLVMAGLAGLFAFLTNKKLEGKSKKTFQKTAIGSFAGLFAVGVFAIIFSALTTVTIGDQNFNRNTDSISIYGTIITEKDFEEIKELKNLTSLSISGCFLDDESVKKISELTQLTELCLDLNTDITNIDSLNNLTNLTTLSISNTKVEDISKLSALTNLTALDISNTQIKDVSVIKNFASLEYLYMNSLENLDASTIVVPETLLTIEFQNNNLESIDFLEGLKNLSTVNGFNNKISDLSPLSESSLYSINFAANDLSSISGVNYSEISNIDFSTNNITDISCLEGNSAYTIDLSYNNITDISALKDSTNLISLHLNNNNIFDISALKDCFAISTLNISYNNISDLSVLSTIDDLQYFDARNNNIKDIKVLKNCKTLKSSATHIDLRNNVISDISALSGYAALEVLYISDNKIKDLSPLSTISTLQSLFANNNEITDVAPLADLASLSTLQVVGNDIEDLSLLTLHPEANSFDIATLHISYNKNIDFSKFASAEKTSVYIYDAPPRAERDLENLGSDGILYGVIVNPEGELDLDAENEDVKAIERLTEQEEK